MKNKAQTLIQIWLPILLLLGLARLFSAATDTPLRHLMVDPTEVMHVPFYTGIMANLGILLWTAAASVCLFISLFLSHLVGKVWKDFFLVSGLLTLFLLLDDLLRIHDEILPVYMGIKGDLLGIAYVLLIGLYLFRYRLLILQYPYTLLVMALGLFAISTAIDVAPPSIKNLFSVGDIIFFEDGAKLLGIANWLAYYAHLSASIVSEASPAAGLTSRVPSRSPSPLTPQPIEGGDPDLHQRAA